VATERRRAAAAVAVLLAIGCSPAASGTAPAGGAPAGGTTVVVDLAHPGRAIPAGFLGLGLEFTDILGYTGVGAGAPDPVFLRLLRGVADAGAGPMPWRIGGNSTDQSWWNPVGRPRPPGIGYDLNPAWLDAVSRTAAASGASVVLGVNLSLNDPAGAVTWARAAQAAFGAPAIAAFEIGNEPNSYAGSVRPAGYTLASYADEYATHAAAIRGALGPATPLAGPGVLSRSWMTGLGGFLDRDAGAVQLVTYHQYPLSVCGRARGDAGYPTIGQLLDPASSHGLAAEAAPFAAQAAARGLPFRVDEMNSVVCLGAAGVSDTFASALWLADVLFEYAGAGVAGVNIQCINRAFYAPFRFDRRGGARTVTVGPSYAGLLLAAEALRPGARLLPASSSGALSAGVKVWATLDRGVVRAVLLNEGSAPVHLQLAPSGTGGAGEGTLARLTAPSSSATSGVQLAGQSYEGSGDGGPAGQRRMERVTAARGSFSVLLPAASGAILTIPAIPA
jgi:Glycosyl hydrolase family 79 C-terminal beta domain